MPDPLIVLDRVSHVFAGRSGQTRAVDEVSLELEPGKVLCLVGESGSGKTTTARIAAGLTRPTAGTVRFQGTDIRSLTGDAATGFRRAVQYIHQDPYASLNPVRDVFGNFGGTCFRYRFAVVFYDSLFLSMNWKIVRLQLIVVGHGASPLVVRITEDLGLGSEPR